MALASQYVFAFTGPDTTDLERLNSLGRCGPLKVAQDHKVAVMLPGAVDTTSFAFQTVQSRDTDGLFIPFLIFDPGLRSQPTHFIIKPLRLSALVEAVDGQAMDWTPIPGDVSEAMIKARERIGPFILGLPDAMRTLTVDDVLFYGESHDQTHEDRFKPDTASWYDHMTVGMMLDQGGGPKGLAQFLDLLPNRYKRDGPDSRASGAFAEAIVHIKASVGVDMTTMGLKAQAARIATWFNMTKPAPPALEQYITVTEITCFLPGLSPNVRGGGSSESGL